MYVNATLQDINNASPTIIGIASAFGFFVLIITILAIYNHFMYVCVVYRREYPVST